MRKFENIVKSQRPPSRYSLWLHDGKLEEFFNGEWITVLNGGEGNGSSGSIDSEALNKEINDRINADKQLQTNIDNISKNVNTEISNLGNNLSGINSDINSLRSTKQDKLVAGTGIKLEGATISVDLDLTLYKVVTSLPVRPATSDKNKIFLVPADNTESQNKYIEYLFNNEEGIWEKIGETTTQIDLEGYVKDSDLERELESAISALNLSSFETKENASKTYQPKGDYLTQQDLSTYVTIVALGEAIKGFITNEQLQEALKGINITDQLENYIDKETFENTLKNKANTTDIPSLVGYATEAWVIEQNYLTDHQSLDNYPTREEVTKQIAAAVTGGEVDLDGYATEEWVLSKNYLTEHQSLEGLVSNDTFSLAMAGKADIETVNELIANAKSEILGGAGEDYDTLKEIEEWVTTHQDLYQGLISTIAGKADSEDLEDMATKTWVEEQNYLKEHQSLEDYPTKEEIEENYTKKDGSYPDLEAGSAGNLLGKTDIVNASMYRPTGGNEDVLFGTKSVESIQGNAVAWNQLVKNGNFAEGFKDWETRSDSEDSYTIDTDKSILMEKTSNIVKVPMLYKEASFLSTHKYLIKVEAKTTSKYIRASFREELSSIGKNDVLYINTTDRYKSDSIITRPTANSRFFTIALSDADVAVGDTSNIKSAQLFDLTLIYGTGNEPTTAEQFEADYQRWFGKLLEYEEYDEGSIRTVLATGIKTVGFNLWSFGDKFDDVDAGNWTNKYYIYNDFGYTGQFIISADITKTTLTDANGAYFYIAYTDGSGAYTNITGTGHISLTTSVNKVVRYIKTSKGSGNNIFSISNICVHMVWSGKRDGDYEPYWEETQPLPITSLTSGGKVIFPDGLKRAGNVYDEIFVENGVTKAVKRVGSVDLGSLSWLSETIEIEGYEPWGRFSAPSPHSQNIGNIWNTIGLLCSRFMIKNIPNNNPNPVDRCLGIAFDRIYITDFKYKDDVASLKQSLQGTLLYYELAEPEVYILDNFNLPVVCKIDDFGTEQVLSPENSIAPVLTSKYGINAVDTLRRLPKKYISAESDDDFLKKLNIVTGVTWSKSWNEEKGIYEYSYEGEVHNSVSWEDITDKPNFEGVSTTSEQLTNEVTAGKAYFNSTSNVTVDTYNDFTNNTSESIITSTYPILFEGDKIRNAQYIPYLTTESGIYVYTLKRLAVSIDDYIIVVNCTVYE